MLVCNRKKTDPSRGVETAGPRVDEGGKWLLRLDCAMFDIDHDEWID